MGSRKDISDFFTLFFDPKIPFLFIFGAIALAIIGNGVYDLLLQTIGATSIGILRIVIGALAVILGSTVVLWILFREKLRSYKPPKGIIVFVGPSELKGQERGAEGANPAHGIEGVIIERLIEQNKHLQFCGLVLLKPSPYEGMDGIWEKTSLKAERIKNSLSSVFPYVRLIEVRKHYPEDDIVELTYRAIAEITDEAKSIVRNAPIAVDITGGTKEMTFGAIKACIEANIQMMYMPIVIQSAQYVDFLPVRHLVITDK